MKRYRCHKIVEAARIMRMDSSPMNGWILTLEDGEAVRVSTEWFGKHLPQVDGYYVKYQDGYASYSPALAFEEGYTPETEDYFDSFWRQMISIWKASGRPDEVDVSIGKAVMEQAEQRYK